MKKVVRMAFGSHLYGLNTPDSDKDYKGIFIPELDDILLSKAPKEINSSTGDDGSKNTKDDIDEGMYSLLYFVELALKGETVALDMLHCTDPIETSPEWAFLVQNRKLFYTKNLKAFMGYLKRQVAKYSVKGSRLADIQRVITLFNELRSMPGWCDSITLRQLWEELPDGEFLKKVTEKRINGNTFYVVNEKMYQDTLKVIEVQDKLQAMYDGYGARAKLAEKNDSVDWKAVSHAFRAGYQLRDIYVKGDFEYPLAETDYIKAVKLGKVDFKSDAQPRLEALMDEIEELAKKSDLPEHPNRKFWEDWVLNVYKEKLL